MLWLELGSLGRTLVTIVASKEETNEAIISYTFENRGAEMVAPFCVAIQCG